MKRLWTSSACLLCYARKADAEVVPRWPILFQLDILSSITVVELGARYAAPVQPSIQQGMASTGLVPPFWAGVESSQRRK